MIRTATGKEAALVAFYEQLSRDGMTVTDLSDRARVGRTNLTLLLNGRRSGKHTWKHVLPLLSKKALFLLKQCSAWNTTAEKELGHLKRAKAWMKNFTEGKFSP